MQLVDSLILMCPLQVQLDFLNQGQAVGTSNVQLLQFTYPILLR